MAKLFTRPQCLLKVTTIFINMCTQSNMPLLNACSMVLWPKLCYSLRRHCLLGGWHWYSRLCAACPRLFSRLDWGLGCWVLARRRFSLSQITEHVTWWIRLSSVDMITEIMTDYENTQQVHTWAYLGGKRAMAPPMAEWLQIFIMLHWYAGDLQSVLSY